MKKYRIIEKGKRLEASVFDIDSRFAQEILQNCKWDIVSLGGQNGFLENAYYPGRFKRAYVDQVLKGSMGFIGSSEMLDVKPNPIKFLTPELTNVDMLKVEEDTILLSRSGTIGNLTLVLKTLKKFLVSEHAIRLICKEFPGYVYAFLRTNIGQTLIKSNIHGAVVSQVEPEHLSEIPIPKPPKMLQKQIDYLIHQSFSLRDESNDLIQEAMNLLIESLKLPPINVVKEKVYNEELKSYSVKLSEINNRVDASYHLPIVDEIESLLNNSAEEVTTLDDKRISKGIILPGRFKRVYVEEGQGVVFIGGKQLNELDPVNKKYLSPKHHKKVIQEQLSLKQNMTLITCSGTIGKTALVPRHWENWCANQHIIRIIPATEDIAGYLYLFLTSDYGYELITRFTYGSVVDEIDDNHVRQIKIPLLKDKKVQQKINDIVLESNNKRYEAYNLEQEAINKVNEIIYAEK